MAKENNILEEAIIQMKNLEEAVAENAKGILASTMKQEIKDLVKESLTEADEEDDEMIDDTDVADVEFPEDDEDDDDDFEDSEDEEEISFPDDEEEEEVIDMRHLDDMGLSDEEKKDVLYKVFKAMGPEDQIQVEKTPIGFHLSDENTDSEYMIVGDESEFGQLEESYMDEEYLDEVEEEGDEDYSELLKNFDIEEETIYEVEMDEEMDEMYHSKGMKHSEMDEEMGEMYHSKGMKHSEMDEEMDEMYDSEIDEYEMEEGDMYEGADYQMDEELYESKKSFKPKGKGMGKPSFEYGKHNDFKMPKQKQGTKGVGMGKAKFEYKDSPSFDGEFDQKPTKKKEAKEGMMVTPKKEGQKMETKEASRTYGNGKYWGRDGLPKPKAAPRHIRKESIESEEVSLLREKNEEYRKALNVFRNKLNEVAVFNSNLAYATRLFTEHSTSKQEKISILKRFDEVENLKESKTLYKIIKDELTSSKTQQVNESIERTINKVPTNGSAINLIESKTYENPQFQRMKDLMSKLK